MQPFAAMPLAQQQQCAAIAARERGHGGDPFLPRALTLGAAHDIDPLPRFRGPARQGQPPGRRAWHVAAIALHDKKIPM